MALVRKADGTILYTADQIVVGRHKIVVGGDGRLSDFNTDRSAVEVLPLDEARRRIGA